jgi:hypothetical protein
MSMSLRGGEVECIVREAYEKSGIRVEERQSGKQVEDGTGAAVGLRVGATHGRSGTTTGGLHLGNCKGDEPGGREKDSRIASQPRQDRPQNAHGPSRQHFAYFLDSFPVLKPKEEQAFGEYMSKRKCLEEYDRIGTILNAEYRIMMDAE